MILNTPDPRKRPRFSVVVPTYGRPGQLARCLEALALQDCAPWSYEVVVVDDGGPAPLDPVVRPFEDRLDVTLVRQANAGAGSARNAGARLARGRYLAFTDDDCQPAPHWLGALDAHFSKRPGSLCGGETCNALADNVFSQTSQIIVEAAYAHYNREPDDAVFFASNNIAAPAALFAEVGGFDPRFRVASEDRELCDRWRHRGHRLAFVPEAVVWHSHRLSLGSFLRQHFRYGRGAWRFHRVRSRRGSGKLVHEARFHLRFLLSLRRRLAGSRPGRAAVVCVLLGSWQLVNLAGFLFESLRQAALPSVAATYRQVDESRAPSRSL